MKTESDIVEKDDKEERKYEAEEKEVEEIRKSVSERRKEIEKRLSLEKPLEKRIDGISEKVSLEREDLSEKEIAEEKRVSSPDEEPSELSFEQKRLSFEQGKRVIEMKPDKTTMKEVKERADERFLAEERKAAEALQEKKSTVEETTISFQEKRKSFEQGLKEEKSIEKEDLKKEDVRKDSALFEGVSQGLVRLDAAFTAAPQVQDLLSPKVSKTPPPSPAEFKDITAPVHLPPEAASEIMMLSQTKISLIAAHNDESTHLDPLQHYEQQHQQPLRSLLCGVSADACQQECGYYEND
ncbi:hypothetical protein J6590_041979 [Homalodisca vitripennis]|nr:hypothetical protein J6590_041979 [Homalodisca vitripennis]